ncbi:MAG: hypothetical protein Q9173_002001 [Seirophora scorigena]
MSDAEVKSDTVAARDPALAGWADQTKIHDFGDMPEWAANARRYEWSDEFGDIGPSDEELERMLFRDGDKMEVGDRFIKLKNIAVTVESETAIQPIINFDDAGLHPVVRENVKLCGFQVPTPIQAYCLPAVLKNRDVIGIAQTGSGKTAAYLIPAISKLMGKARKLCGARPNVVALDFDLKRDGVRAEPLILVVVPTRELATQVFDEARRLCYRSMLRPCVAYGGAPSGEQANQLRKGCDVLIATPGRLMDFLERGHLLSLSRVKYTVIDEADEMVSGDWNSCLDVVMGGADSNADSDHLYLFFSATFNKQARMVAKKYMSTDHVRVRVGRAGSTHENITQRIVFAEPAQKRNALWDLLMAMPPARTMIFANTKREVDLIDDYLWNKGLPATSIHSDRTQREREDAIRAYKSGKAPILVTTGVAARGLDLKNTLHIINYDFPDDINEYVHRIGRTARIGNVGLSTSLYNEKNEGIAEDLVKLLMEANQEIPDFLEAFKPSEGELDFQDDSGAEEEENAAGGAADGGDGAGCRSTGWQPFSLLSSLLSLIWKPFRSGTARQTPLNTPVEHQQAAGHCSSSMTPSTDIQTPGFAASTRHPRHLPTPVTTRSSSMAFQNNVSQDMLQHHQHQALPSLEQGFGNSEQVSSFEASPIHSGPTPAPTEAWCDLPDTPRFVFDADEVMKKALETMNDQIRANGFDPDNLPTSNHHVPVNGHKEINAVNPSNGHSEERNEEMESNPYEERADRIGLSHRIPGIGHLGDLLTPPGWMPGDEPISANLARLLQEEAHQAAKQKLQDSIVEFQDLKGAAFQEASDLRNEEWQNQNVLNKLVCEERIKVWVARQEQKKNGGQQRGRNYSALNYPPAPIANGQPARHQRNHRPILPAVTLSGPDNGLNGPEPSPNLLSPSFLDPSLLSPTARAVFQRYHTEDQHIQLLHRNNEQYLKHFLGRYGPHLHPDHQPLPQAGRQTQTNSRADHQVVRQESSACRLARRSQPHSDLQNVQREDGSGNGATVQQARRPSSYPTPPPRFPTPHPESYVRSSDNQQTETSDNENQGLTANRYGVLQGQDGLGVYEEPSDLALTPVKPQHRGQRGQQEVQPDTPPTNTPSKKRKAPKKASPKKSTFDPSPKLNGTGTSTTAKKEPWYASQLAALPTSTITPEAVRAGLAYDPKGPLRAAPPTKKRRRGSEPVPVPSFVVPEDKIKALFKSGLPIRYTGTGPNPYLDNHDEEDARGGANVPKGKRTKKMGGAPVVPAMGSGKVKYGEGAKAKAARVGSKESPLLLDGPSSTPSTDYSLESKADDPSDGTYGARGKSGKRASPRKSVLAKRARGGWQEE